MLCGGIESAIYRLSRRPRVAHSRTAAHVCMRVRVRTASAAAVRGAAGVALATAAAAATAVATAVGMVAVVGVGEGSACVQSRVANVEWLSLRCKIEWVVRHGPKHLLCPLAPHALGCAGLKRLWLQRNVDDRDLTAAFDLDEVYRKSRAVVAVGVYNRLSENL